MISVSKNNQTAVKYVSDFIDNQWQDEYNRYINIEFSDITKSDIRKFCLQEQENVCCYCGREIQDDFHTELEHIIPRSVKTNDELQPYFFLSNILAENIVLQDNFKVINIKMATPPFPHHIAYHNIVASCNGKTTNTSEDTTCCNRNRQHEFVPPFNLMANSIEYLNDGTVYYVNDEKDNRYLNPLNLNKVLLKNIRRIWYLFANSDVTENLLIQANNVEQYKELFSIYIDINPIKTIADTDIINSFKTEVNWNLLLKYKYFLNYFRNNKN